MLLQLPNEVLLRTLNNLDKASTVCLALSCHQAYDLILSRAGATKLNHIVPYYFPIYNQILSDTARRELMLLLVDWVPSQYVLCEERMDKFVVRKNGSEICARCEDDQTRREWERAEAHKREVAFMRWEGGR